MPGEGSRLVTTLTRHPGGASVQVHARIDESFTLVYDAIVSRGGAATALPTAVGAGTAVAETAGDGRRPSRSSPKTTPAILHDNLTAGAGIAAGFAKWSPDSGETIGDRLGTIVGGAMGYEPEDLPWEVPLIELGLDSLMAVRIKNRVEYDFDLPPIQLTAVRDANLYAVEKLIAYAVEHRDEVERARRAPEDADRRGDRRGAGRADGRGDHRRRARGQAGRSRASDRSGRAEAASRPELPKSPPPRTRRCPAIPPPPTDPSGPSASGDQSRGRGWRAQVLTQQAVTEALGADVPPRDAAERVTFATWAIVTGKSPGGIFNELPSLDATRRPRRWPQRLSERAEGTITAEHVSRRTTIQDLSTIGA